MSVGKDINDTTFLYFFESHLLNQKKKKPRILNVLLLSIFLHPYDGHSITTIYNVLLPLSVIT